MATPRQPQDHKPKATSDAFTFTHKGEEHTFPKPFSTVRQPKFMRANRRRDEIDLAFTMIEELAGDDEAILEAIDDMDEDEFEKLAKRMGKAMNAPAVPELGESAAS